MSRGRCPEEMFHGEMPRGDDLSRGRCPEEMFQGEMPRGGYLSRGRCPWDVVIKILYGNTIPPQLSRSQCIICLIKDILQIYNFAIMMNTGGNNKINR